MVAVPADALAAASRGRAYHVDTDDGAIVFSGATSPSDNLVELAPGVGVLVHGVIARG